MNNNKGFSLLEMMVVIAIIGVLLAGAGISISYISSTNARSAKSKVFNAIETARMMSTVKANGGYFTIKVADGKYYYQVGTGSSENKLVLIEDTEICSTVLPIMYRVEGGTDSTISSEFTLYFSKATGALKNGGEYEADGASSNLNNKPMYITIGKYLMKIFPLTGKVEVQ